MLKGILFLINRLYNITITSIDVTTISNVTTYLLKHISGSPSAVKSTTVVTANPNFATTTAAATVNASDATVDTEAAANAQAQSARFTSKPKLLCGVYLLNTTSVV
ncbi:hypothetical protein MAM1_0006d00768 [Mucor ambiguus]|uniref:Uncharacterized protein n=1 Tax=Mucor ambiguus TaxID=91626 RepID=A0A0C9LQA0_9FUNG|nr:hypothetical protein MAM1_0006d00768 [Mucor ambiguus]